MSRQSLSKVDGITSSGAASGSSPSAGGPSNAAEGSSISASGSSHAINKNSYAANEPSNTAEDGPSSAAKPGAKPFGRLSRAYQESTYISYRDLSNHTATAFEFGGGNGYAGAVNYGGELLQMTAPSEKHGILFARGPFKYTVYSSLARGQRWPGGKSTFGVQLPSTDNTWYDGPRARDPPRLVLSDKMLENGSFNYRWPVNRYTVHVDGMESSAGKPRMVVGTCSMISHVHGRFVYQLLHFDLGSSKIPAMTDVVLRLGGSISFKSYRHCDHSPSMKPYNGGQAAEREERANSSNQGNASWLEDTTCTAEYVWEADRSVRLEARIYRIESNGKASALPLRRRRGRLPVLIDEPVRPQGYLYETTVGVSAACGQGKPQGSFTFIAVFALFEEHDGFSWPSSDCQSPGKGLLLSDQELYAHLGIESNSLLAIGTMWETAFLEKGEDSYAISELSEVSLVGRCLEKTLQVELMPVTFDKPKGQQVTGPMAIISSLFIQANLDLKAIFSVSDALRQAKSHKAPGQGRKKRDDAGTKEKECGSETDTENSRASDSDLYERLERNYSHELQVIDYQLSRLERAISSVVQYLVDALIRPQSTAAGASKIGLLPDNHVRGESNYYYVMMTIWYVIANYPEYSLPWKDGPGTEPYEQFDIGWKDEVSSWQEPGLMQGDNRLPDDDWVFEKSVKVKAVLLKWFHYGSISNLVACRALPRCWVPSTHPGNDFGDTIRLLERKAKMALATQVATQPDYAEPDEIVDRLAFVAGELRLDSDRWSRRRSHNFAHRGIDISDMASKRIMSRDYSRALYPGMSPADYDGLTSGPWEMHALCHHSRLLVANQKSSEAMQLSCGPEKVNCVSVKAELERFRGNFRWFLASDASLVPCWVRSSSAARKGWLPSEATSVLATTLIDICLKDLEQTFALQLQKLDGMDTKRRRPSVSTAGMLSRPIMVPGAEQRLTAISIEALTDSLARRVARLEKGEYSELPPIDWTVYAPPRKYHPDEFFMSLDDTPNAFARHKIEKVELPLGLRDFFYADQELVEEPAEQDFPGGCLRSDPFPVGPIAVEDGAANAPVLRPKTGSRIRYPDYSYFCDLINGAKPFEGSRVLHSMSIADLVSTDGGQGSDSTPLKCNLVGAITLEAGHSEEEATAMLKTLRSMVTDSLVDLGAQHRFIALTEFPGVRPSCSRDPEKEKAAQTTFRHQLQLLAYVLHTESIDCLNSHILRASHFSCKMGDQWAARITVRSWKKVTIDVPAKPEVKDHNDDLAMEDLPIRVPTFLESWFKKKDPEGYTDAFSHAIELRTSSVVLSTNGLGDFTKCTIISQTIAKDDLKELANHSPLLWQQFTHQPQTARCLIFLMVLSVLCRGIAREMRQAVDFFVKPLELENIFIRSSEDWILDSENSRQKAGQLDLLKLGLFCLEALFKLRNTLAGSMTRIEDARTTLLAQIADGPGRRSVPLERICNEYLEHLDRSLAELGAIATRLERKVELNSRYRDSLSTILALRDSQNSIQQNTMSIHQNRTIERLTLLTIGYLPLSLTAAIFAIPEEQHVIAKEMRLKWFIGIVILLFTATVVVASSIDTLKRVHRFWTGWARALYHWLYDGFWHILETIFHIERPPHGVISWFFKDCLRIRDPYGHNGGSGNDSGDGRNKPKPPTEGGGRVENPSSGVVGGSGTRRRRGLERSFRTSSPGSPLFPALGASDGANGSPKDQVIESHEEANTGNPMGRTGWIVGIAEMSKAWIMGDRQGQNRPMAARDPEQG